MELENFKNELKRHFEDDVRFDKAATAAYSVDASIYEIEPLGIVAPRNESDLLFILAIAKQFSVPIIPRGAATGITGGCLGSGLIIDLSRYFNQILEINYDKEYVICQPGVVQDDLNMALSQRGYRLGPDTSTGNRATIGGMLANNAAGARSLRFGKMVDHVEEVQLALADGVMINFGDVTPRELLSKVAGNSIESSIYRKIHEIRSQHAEEIKKHFPKIPRRVSGYNLDELIKPGPLNLAKLIAGSEGSLGIATRIKLRIVKKETNCILCVVHFDDLLEAFEKIQEMRQFSPLSLELIDDKIVAMGRRHPLLKDKLDWLIGQPKALIVVEFDGETETIASEQLKLFKTAMVNSQIGYAYSILNSNSQMAQVWELRKSGLGLLLSKRTYSRAIAFIEDISVPPNELAAFMKKFLEYLKNKGKEAGIYGHAGAGCLHIRPYIDLRHSNELALMEQMMLDVSDLLLEHGGALSGEHGDGFLRTWLNEKMFGKRLYQLFCEVKEAFDPSGRMNPGKVVHPSPFLQNLRLSPATPKVHIKTFQDFSAEGGFELSADLCNGNGLCRKSEKLMCPSFQATKNELHTTRARAQGLRAIINGRWPIAEMAGNKLYELLDLCLECKGCKTECPSQVDMAKMKSEFLYHYQNKHGIPLRSWLFGHIGLINQLTSPFAGLFNRVAAASPLRKLLSFLGIAPQRTLPKMGVKRFSSWYRDQPADNFQKTVVLFNDTFTEFNQPEVGKAAVKVLKALNYNVIVPQWGCCGRPLLSKGMLKAARKKAIAVMNTLYPLADKNFPIIGLEPSCILTISDDYAALIGKEDREADKKIKKIKALCTTFDEFIFSQMIDGKLPMQLCDTVQKALVHGHCHQKALVGMQKTMDMLNALPGYAAAEIPSGCCGLAGSFGYEKEHYDISLKIADLKLTPAVNAADADTEIIANGFSCRCQISHCTGRGAVHLAQALANRLLM